MSFNQSWRDQIFKVKNEGKTTVSDISAYI